MPIPARPLEQFSNALLLKVVKRGKYSRWPKAAIKELEKELAIRAITVRKSGRRK